MTSFHIAKRSVYYFSDYFMVKKINDYISYVEKLIGNTDLLFLSPETCLDKTTVRIFFSMNLLHASIVLWYRFMPRNGHVNFQGEFFMARKMEPHISYGEKLVSLFVRLLFEGKSYSLNELCRILKCSKPSVLRILNDIRKSYGVTLDEEFRGREKYVSARKSISKQPVLSLTESEWHVLSMCRTFTERLLGRKLFEEATQALLKSKTHLQEGDRVTTGHFACFRPGMIDYTPYHEIIHTLIRAMDSKKICLITYQALEEGRAKSYYIMPFKLFSHQDTVYLHARKARTPGQKYRAPEFDPLLAVHRMKKIEITDRGFEQPQNYDFDRIFNLNFGVIKEEAFEVEVEFTGWAARYVAERIWSPDQKITGIGKNKIRLNFTASSEPEVISWVLSFGEEAQLIEPNEMVNEMANKIKTMNAIYS